MGGAHLHTYVRNSFADLSVNMHNVVVELCQTSNVSQAQSLLHDYACLVITGVGWPDNSQLSVGRQIKRHYITHYKHVHGLHSLQPVRLNSPQ